MAASFFWSTVGASAAHRTVGALSKTAVAIKATEVAADAVRFRVSIGVDTGSVSVGLAGRSGMVYDAWGDAVGSAINLARRAPDHGVAVTERVRRQLPDGFMLGDELDVADGSVLVVGVQPEDAPT